MFDTSPWTRTKERLAEGEEDNIQVTDDLPKVTEPNARLALMMTQPEPVVIEEERWEELYHVNIQVK